MKSQEFTQEDLELISREYASLKEVAARRCASEEELGIVQKAFDFADNAHRGVRRRSGEPYIIHPVEVARIVVCDIGLGYKSIVAALLHDVVEDTDYTIDDIRNLFGDKIATLVEGLTKIKNVLDKEDQAKTQSMQAENFKRILLTLNDDIRVVLIKLADRLHNCRTIEYMPEYKREKILSETMFIFIPLAHRLGLYDIKSEMEDIWLKYKEPKAYEEIAGLVTAKVEDKMKEIDEFIEPIKNILDQIGFSYIINKRIKTPYSIWHKMQVKGVTFEEIYDICAIRIIFDPDKSNVLKGEDDYSGSSVDKEKAQCFLIYSLITSIYMEKIDRKRDWVKNPKSNGYEALHCTLMGSRGTWMEVQIRSRRMNDIAEKGIAAHWSYKKNGFSDGGSESEMELWINKVKNILSDPDVSSLDLLDIIHNDLTTTEIFVFTPKGEQKRIQKGATALDFAYLIHSHIGNTAMAAKVNGRLKDLSYVIQTGDQIEIITAEDQKPKREWLGFLKTHKARSIVNDYFKEVAAAEGDTIEEEFRHKPSQKQKSTWNLLRLLNKAGNAKQDYVIRTDGGVSPDGNRYVFASCCSPIPGDQIFGFKEADGTITVHKKTCPTANSLASKYGESIIIPKWENAGAQESALVRISLKGIDRIGVLSEISRIISLVMNLNIREFTLKASDDIFEGYMILSVKDTAELDRLIGRLKRIDGLNEVVRKDL